VTIFEHVNQTEDISKRTRTRTRANKTTTPDGIEKERKKERGIEKRRRRTCVHLPFQKTIKGNQIDPPEKK
jgi:hypothetical protein